MGFVNSFRKEIANAVTDRPMISLTYLLYCTSIILLYFMEFVTRMYSDSFEHVKSYIKVTLAMSLEYCE